MSCSGIGTIHRGIESFFREAFCGLKPEKRLDLRLLKGAGAIMRDEHVLWNLRRTGVVAQLAAAVARRSPYVIEQWSSLFSVIRQIRRFRPHIVFYSEANLGFLLYWLRGWIDVPYRLLFSNGGPIHPPFIRADYVHQVAPCYYAEALRAGERAERHFFVPYGINPVPAPVPLEACQREALRSRLGLPKGRQLVLSVGWIQRVHKRMDYVIKEIARLPAPRPFLVLLGAVDEASKEIVRLGNGLLGSGNFTARSVSYERVADYYRAADCFVLASLQEGFGRVYLEALMHGLPVLAHDNAVTRFVLGSKGMLGNLNRPGELAKMLAIELRTVQTVECSHERWQWVQDRFSWEVLRPGYYQMFEACALADQPNGALETSASTRNPMAEAYD